MGPELGKGAGRRAEGGLLGMYPGEEGAVADHLAGVEHVPVEEPAELGAADREAALTSVGRT